MFLLSFMVFLDFLLKRIMLLKQSFNNHMPGLICHHGINTLHSTKFRNSVFLASEQPFGYGKEREGRSLGYRLLRKKQTNKKHPSSVSDKLKSEKVKIILKKYILESFCKNNRELCHQQGVSHS